MFGRAANDRVGVVVKLRVVDRKAGRKANKVRVANMLELSDFRTLRGMSSQYHAVSMLQRTVVVWKDGGHDDAARE